MTTSNFTSLLESQQFSRYVMYLSHIDFVDAWFHAKSYTNEKIIEFGGSNQFVKTVFNSQHYEIAGNYPGVDIQNLEEQENEYYDFVILDEILEHVKNPQMAISEVYRILKMGGWLITSSPFLVRIHKCPSDYWRFSEEGLASLLSCFSEVELNSWGNKKAVEIILDNIMISIMDARRHKDFSLVNNKRFPVTVWAYARK